MVLFSYAQAIYSVRTFPLPSATTVPWVALLRMRATGWRRKFLVIKGDKMPKQPAAGYYGCAGAGARACCSIAPCALVVR